MNNTITEYITKELKNKKITHTVFTTYNFEPEFFETEIIPLLFQEDIYFSNHPTVKRYQVKQVLERSGIGIELFYDKNIFSSEETPQMEYYHQAINHLNGAFHPKVMYLLFEDSDAKQSLLLYAGSNNITKAGWWDNIETGNYILINNKHAISKTTHENIEKSLRYLKEQQVFESSNSSIVAIKKFLENNVKISESNSTHFYFQSDKEDRCRQFFEKFLSSKITHVEIVSPFFPDAEDSKLHREVFPKTYHIKMLLPKNQQDEAMCTQAYYEYCKRENIVWSKFSSKLERNLGIDKDAEGNSPIYRKLHAKIFHFYNKQNSWFFTGSFNFTYKALNDNIEAGFLFKNDLRSDTLLEEINGNEVFELKLEDIDNPTVEGEEEIKIAILFDWNFKKLKIELAEEVATQKLVLCDNAGNELQTINLSDKSISLTEISAKLLLYLEKNSYIYISKQSILIQHINWQYKPFTFWAMSISEILSIYSGLNINEKEDRFIAHMLKELEKQGALYESSVNDISIDERNFFSEYSEIFYSFRKLKAILLKSKTENNHNILEYYFRMQYPDSFSSVVKKIVEDSELDIATKYIVVLSLEEIYNEVEEYKNCDEFKNLTNLKETIKQKIGEKDPEQKDFLEWFEFEFMFKHIAKEKTND